MELEIIRDSEGGRKPDVAPVRQARVQFLVTTEERRKIRYAAAEADISVSELLRPIVLRHLGIQESTGAV